MELKPNSATSSPYTYEEWVILDDENGTIVQSTESLDIEPKPLQNQSESSSWGSYIMSAGSYLYTGTKKVISAALGYEVKAAIPAVANKMILKYYGGSLMGVIFTGPMAIKSFTPIINAASGPLGILAGLAMEGVFWGASKAYEYYSFKNTSNEWVALNQSLLQLEGPTTNSTPMQVDNFAQSALTFNSLDTFASTFAPMGEIIKQDNRDPLDDFLNSFAPTQGTPISNDNDDPIIINPAILNASALEIENNVDKF